jgi:hypothetical protein
MFLNARSLVSVFANPLTLLARNYYDNEGALVKTNNFDLSKATGKRACDLNLFTISLDKPRPNGRKILGFDNIGQPEIQSALSITDDPSISTFAALDAMFRVKKFFESFDNEGKLVKTGQYGENNDFDFHQKFLDNFKALKNAVINLAKNQATKVADLINQARRINVEWTSEISDPSNAKKWIFAGKSIADREFDTTEDWRKLQQELPSGVGS